MTIQFADPAATQAVQPSSLRVPGVNLSRLASFTLVSLLLGASTVAASELQLRWQDASGDVVAERTLSLDELDGLPQRSLQTSTPWTQGTNHFTGTGLADLAALVQAGVVVSADLTALNDYVASVPAEDWQTMPLLLANRMNGKIMPVYEKGPFWLVYPVDTLERPLPQAFMSRMVWQVASITFHVR